MSLVVKLEDDLGERSEWVLLHGVVPTNNHADFLLLSGIDPFGKTVFNICRWKPSSRNGIARKLASAMKANWRLGRK